MNGMRPIALAGLALSAACLSPAPAAAASRGIDTCARHAPEAARRSGLPVDVILRVMHAESRGRPRAVSHKGATGCMQIMPATWAYLTRRHGLGDDPFDPRMNMIGGALYLAELARQFGFPGAYSAYNAGPGRYQRHMRGGAPLPAETVAYTAQITGTAPVPARSGFTGRPATLPRWQEAELFAAAAGSRSPPDAVDRGDGARDQSDRPAANALFALMRPAIAAAHHQPELPADND